MDQDKDWGSLSRSEDVDRFGKIRFDVDREHGKEMKDVREGIFLDKVVQRSRPNFGSFSQSPSHPCSPATTGSKRQSARSHSPC